MPVVYAELSSTFTAYIRNHGGYSQGNLALSHHFSDKKNDVGGLFSLLKANRKMSREDFVIA